MKFSKYISPRKKKNFEMKYILEISSPDFGKPQKFHDFVFVSTGFELKSFPPGKDSKMNLSLLEKD